MKTLLKGGKIVNEGITSYKDILIHEGKIQKIEDSITPDTTVNVIDVSGKIILPGCIDDQVHFREPGLTHKGTIYSE